MSVGVKEYTGEEYNKFALILCGKRINLYFSGRNTDTDCDKIITTDSLSLGDVVLPLKLVREHGREYVLEYSDADTAKAEDTLKTGLIERLENEIGEDGEIITSEFTTDIEEGLITVTIKAECVERIDKQRELTEEEKLSAGEGEYDGGENNQR